MYLEPLKSEVSSRDNKDTEAVIQRVLNVINTYGGFIDGPKVTPT
jgi:hypothetical protein